MLDSKERMDQCCKCKDACAGERMQAIRSLKGGHTQDEQKVLSGEWKNPVKVGSWKKGNRE